MVAIHILHPGIPDTLLFRLYSLSRTAGEGAERVSWRGAPRECSLAQLDTGNIFIASSRSNARFGGNTLTRRATLATLSRGAGEGFMRTGPAGTNGPARRPSHGRARSAGRRHPRAGNSRARPARPRRPAGATIRRRSAPAPRRARSGDAGPANPTRRP